MREEGRKPAWNCAHQLGIIGGSGLYEMPGLQDIETHEAATPFGKPSAPVVVGTLEGRRVAFLARHGHGHHISPSEINYRANIYALKALGVEQVVSISACGSLARGFCPGDIIIPNQLFDFTKNRIRSFFDGGLVAHISVADPFCPVLSQQLFSAVQSTGDKSTRAAPLSRSKGRAFPPAPNRTFASWGMALIGMTTSPEAFLAREAELCYAVMAHVTDYDVWHVSEKPVTVDMVIQVVNRNTARAQEAVRYLARNLTTERPCECPVA